MNCTSLSICFFLCALGSWNPSAPAWKPEVPPSGGVLTSSENIPRAELKGQRPSERICWATSSRAEICRLFWWARHYWADPDQTAKSLVEGLSFGWASPNLLARHWGFDVFNLNWDGSGTQRRSTSIERIKDAHRHTEPPRNVNIRIMQERPEVKQHTHRYVRKCRFHYCIKLSMWIQVYIFILWGVCNQWIRLCCRLTTGFPGAPPTN